MSNDTITQINNLISKAHDVIFALDNDYNIKIYTPEIDLQRGKYGFNINPDRSVTREVSGLLSRPNLLIRVYMHYELEPDEAYQTAWNNFTPKANAILNALYDKNNYPTGVSTVMIDVVYDTPIIERQRVVDLTFLCEYAIFATR